MAYRVELSLPRIVERGRAASLTLPVFSDADAEQTAGGGTLSIWSGGTKIVDEATITVGPPASYSLLAATTTDLALTDDWTEVWTLTNLGVFRHGGFLVRHAYHSRVTDTHLEQVHPEILDLLPPGETTPEKFRVKASEKIQRELLNKGRRPWLIFEPYALLDAEVYLALHYWAQDAAMRTTGLTNYAGLARDYYAAFEREWSRVAFSHYDDDEDGLPGDGGPVTADYGAVILTSGPPRSRSRLAVLR